MPRREGFATVTAARTPTAAATAGTHPGGDAGRCRAGGTDGAGIPHPEDGDPAARGASVDGEVGSTDGDVAFVEGDVAPVVAEGSSAGPVEGVLDPVMTGR